MALSRREFLKAVPVVATTSVLACATYPKRPKAPVLEEVDIIEIQPNSLLFTEGYGEADGGYLVSPDVHEAIVKKITEIDPIRSISRARRSTS